MLHHHLMSQCSERSSSSYCRQIHQHVCCFCWGWQSVAVMFPGDWFIFAVGHQTCCRSLTCVCSVVDACSSLADYLQTWLAFADFLSLLLLFPLFPSASFYSLPALMLPHTARSPTHCSLLSLFGCEVFKLWILQTSSNLNLSFFGVVFLPLCCL